MPVAEDTPRSDTPRSTRRSRLRLGAVLAVALAAAFVVWLLVSGDDDDSTGGGASTSAGEASTAHIATRAEIGSLARSLEYPIYWAGEIPNSSFELTRTGSGRVYIRYLPKGVQPGDRNPRFLTVGTYPQANGYAAVRAASRRPNTISRQAAGGALIVYDRTHPRSTYFSFPGARFQVEVFDPDPGRARRLTLSGRIRRVR